MIFDLPTSSEMVVMLKQNGGATPPGNGVAAAMGSMAIETRAKTLRQVVEWLRVRDVRYHQPDGGSMAAFAVIQDLAEDQGINLEEEDGD